MKNINETKTIEETMNEVYNTLNKMSRNELNNCKVKSDIELGTGRMTSEEWTLFNHQIETVLSKIN